jgi:hypothetical protein
MLTHKVSGFFGDVIEVEHHNTTTPFSSTHYGEFPWATPDPKFAAIAEKFRVFKDGCHATCSEPLPAHCESHVYKRFFRIKKFKAVTSAPSNDKPERRRK